MTVLRFDTISACDRLCAWDAWKTRLFTCPRPPVRTLPRPFHARSRRYSLGIWGSRKGCRPRFDQLHLRYHLGVPFRRLELRVRHLPAVQSTMSMNDIRLSSQASDVSVPLAYAQLRCITLPKSPQLACMETVIPAFPPLPNPARMPVARTRRL
jgi:hypothetical protein